MTKACAAPAIVAFGGDITLVDDVMLPGEDKASCTSKEQCGRDV